MDGAVGKILRSCEPWSGEGVKVSERVLVTGAAGYIGRHVVNELVQRGYEVVANDLDVTGVNPQAILKSEDIFSSLEGVRARLGNPDRLIHLAWKDGFVHNSPEHMGNLSSHVRFLMAMIDQGCSNIAVMGTMHEVGYHVGAITEDTPCNPLSQYGVAKNALRQSLVLLSKTQDFNLHWLRAYYIVGDDIRGSSIFSKITKAAQDGQKLFPFTTGTNQYDFISVQDLAVQIVAASVQDEVTGVINVCSGQPVSLADRVERFIKENGYDIQLQYGKFPDRAYDSPVIYGDSSKIQAIMAQSVHP